MSKESADRFVIIYTMMDGTRKEVPQSVGQISLALVHFNIRMTEVLKKEYLSVELFDRRQQKPIAFVKWAGEVHIKIKDEIKINK